MKRIVLSLFVLLLAAGASAQVVEGLNVVTLRMGDNGVSSPDAGTPTMSLAYEYELFDDFLDVESLCLGVGGQFGFRHYRRTANFPAFYYTYSDIMYALRGTLHYDILGEFFGMHSDHIDTYATLSLGMEHTHVRYIDKLTGKRAVTKDGVIRTPDSWRRRMMPGLQLGCRYWFTPNLGAVAEVGFDGFSFINVGISTCF
ncbi:MAG: hypothetical protein K6B45_07350 [Bacteroidaceae bacterium]|nr:hypothetical protein [Bacteroidaceae bacterium]